MPAPVSDALDLDRILAQYDPSGTLYNDVFALADEVVRLRAEVKALRGDVERLQRVVDFAKEYRASLPPAVRGAIDYWLAQK